MATASPSEHDFDLKELGRLAGAIRDQLLLL